MRRFWAVLLFLGIALFRNAAVEAKNLHLNMRPGPGFAACANSQAALFLMEASEFFAAESESRFFELLDSVVESKEEFKTSHAIWEHILRSEMLSESSRKVLEFSISTHYYLPKLLLHSHLNNSGCSIPVWSNGELICGLNEKILSNILSTQQSPYSAILPSDHEHPSCLNSVGPEIILYGDLLQPDFHDAHKVLSRVCHDGKIRYAIRPWIPSKFHSAGKCGFLISDFIELQGFGVELAIKNMEYKVLDDKEVKQDLKVIELENSFDDSDLLLDHEDSLPDSLFNSEDSSTSEKSESDHDKDNVENAKSWIVKNLGSQIIKKIKSYDQVKQLKVMRDLSLNFPAFASSLKSIEDFGMYTEALQELEKVVNGGYNVLLINGIVFSLDQNDIFSLYDTLESEMKYYGDLRSLNLSSSSIVQLIQDKSPTPSSSQQHRLNIRYSTSLSQVSPFLWINDVEKDVKYKEWNPSLTEALLAPGWPNQIRYVSKNLYNQVTILDPSSLKGLEMVMVTRFFVTHFAPVHAGFVLISPSYISYSRALRKPKFSDQKPLFEPDSSYLIICVFIQIKESLSLELAMDFLEKIGSLIQKSEQSENSAYPEILIPVITAAFNAVASTRFRYSFDIHAAVSKLMEGVDAVKSYPEFSKSFEYLDASTDYVLSKGIFSSAMPVSYFNGVEMLTGVSVTKESYRDSFMHSLLSFQQKFQRDVYYQKLSDRSDIESHIYDQPDVVERINPLIIRSNLQKTFISVPKSIPSLNYVFGGTEDEILVTTWVIVNIQSISGVSLAISALDYALDSTSAIRTSILLDCQLQGKCTSCVEKAFLYLYHEEELDVQRMIDFLILLETANGNEIKFFELFQSSFPQYSSTLNLKCDGISESKFTVQFPEVSVHIPSVIINGQVFQIKADSDVFEKADFEFSISEQISRVQEMISQIPELNGFSADSLLKILIHVFTRSHKVKQKSYFPDSMLKLKDLLIESGNRESAVVHVDALLDPLSEQGQKMSAILTALEENFPFYIRCIINPRLNYDSLPLKRFYRYSFNPKLAFDAKGELIHLGKVRFKSLPTSYVLTLTVDTPEAWLVESSKAIFDLDNIRLEELGSSSTMYVEYQLEHILISGTCHESKMDAAASGLKLELKQDVQKSSACKDTVVMENLGYFQLQANPGIWFVDVAKGAHSEVFRLESSLSGSITGVPVTISTLSPSWISLKASRLPGMESVDLLAYQEKNSGNPPGLWSSLTGMLGLKGASSEYAISQGVEKDYIHIFSIASGHLYERFLKIMMLSVVKNTKGPVKFWFIKQFLSPQFKREITQFATQLGKDVAVELVTYKWPRWLRRQSVKQRTIWGYKILFLDVLFPLKIPRIIFVDADQVVRGNLRELWDLDLQGAPYAYTPFCDSNKETDGFRFWKQGYWKNHLAGRPYHISALYVVDLNKFRRMRAGDILRIIYENLSQDENSLANLDQDLPNYAQENVPIYSLPQEWLWCETWCSMESLPSAKTIDLCNNPLTKEPKLTRAKRIVSEWEDLDQEAVRISQLI